MIFSPRIQKGGIDPASPVAVFDSGAGGIGVLREVKKALPAERFFYFGDTANAPYGEKSDAEILRLTSFHAARLLLSSKALVIACNTATALAVSSLRERYPDRVIVGMEPALLPALAVAPRPRVLVLATPATLGSAKFRRLLEKANAQATVLPVAAAELVPLVESGLADAPKTDETLQKLLAPYLSPRPDAVVLGCTHFPFAARAILRVVGDDVPLFDGAAGTARQLARALGEKGLLSPSGERGGVFLSSSDARALPLYKRLLLYGK
ncbi:MAG: glutamate racemase [Clostridia bacterium]|nr:glutamate racemase [Clostridia bacterium]